MESEFPQLNTAVPLKLSLLLVLALAVSFGVVTGVVEAVGFLTLHHFAVPQLLWVVPLFDAVLFVLIGVAYWLLSRLSRYFSASWLVFVFAWVAFYDWGRVVGASPRWRYVVLVASCLAARGVTSLIARPGLLRSNLITKTACGLAAAVLLCGAGIGTYSSIQERRSIERLRPAGKGRNVLLIVVDTLRADHMPTYGYSRPTAPYLDQLATQSVVFDNAIAPSSWTLPSHASMLSGLYPREHGAEREEVPVRATVPLVSEEFSRRGYRTGAFSANGWLFSRQFGFGRGFAHFQDLYPSAWQLIWFTSYGSRVQNLVRRLGLSRNLLGRKSVEEVNRAALNWIGSSSGGRPFFVALNYMDVHCPYLPPEPFRSRFVRPGARTGYISANFNEFPFLQPQQRQDEIDAYDASIAYVDSQIHSLLEELRRRGVLKDTIVVITSDHGEEFEEHGFYSHGNALYRELVHVPLLVWSERDLPKGMHISQPVSLVHLPATFLKLATGEAATGFPQRSLSELWSSSGGAEWPSPMSELARMRTSPTFPNYRQGFRSITTSEWHYIEGTQSGEELYRCCSNRIEYDNLASQAEMRPVCDRLKAQLGTAPGPRPVVAGTYTNR
jgi:arylsulfatase A-like enzyme